MPQVTMPQLGEGVEQGTIGKWLKAVGDHVRIGDPLVEVVTDKVNAEVPSPFEGTLTQILVAEGDTIPNDAVIAEVEVAGTTSEPAAQATEVPPTGGSPAAPVTASGGAGAGVEAVGKVAAIPARAPEAGPAPAATSIPSAARAPVEIPPASA